MFKSLYECYQVLKENPGKVDTCLKREDFTPVRQFYNQLKSFAFYPDLERLYRGRNEKLNNTF